MTSVHYAGYVTSKTLLIAVLFIRTDRLSCVNIRVIIIIIIIIIIFIMVDHIMSGCLELAKTDYREMRNKAAGYIQCKACQHYKDRSTEEVV